MGRALLGEPGPDTYRVEVTRRLPGSCDGSPDRPGAAALARIAVKGRAPKTSYDRDLFGPAWADVDRNGCDTRFDILTRDLTEESLQPGTHDCVVLTGNPGRPVHP